MNHQLELGIIRVRGELAIVAMFAQPPRAVFSATMGATELERAAQARVRAALSATMEATERERTAREHALRHACTCAQHDWPSAWHSYRYRRVRELLGAAAPGF